MHTARRPLRRAHVASCLIFLFLSVLPALAQRPRIRVEDYQINAEITPKTHHLKAEAKVKFTALEDSTFVSFELHNDLRVTKVLDGNGKPLSPERITQDNAVRITRQRAMVKAMPCKVITMECGHSPFYSQPEELAEHLETIAAS